ncbi:hypothetical protein RDI58_022318 [Solanum bulbocastanum]|uniref:Mitochondrial protein n=1 Tax=Solanum bulbocastanum TaxID=147425 RepID=A0AAN8T2G1_SOLBU
MSHYERLYNHKPSLLHIRVLGCLCYAKINQTNKLKSRTTTAVFMGYSEVQKGYILYDLHSKSFFVNRDVVFKENKFPFMIKTVDPPLFQQLDLVSQSLVNFDSLDNPVCVNSDICLDSANSHLEVDHSDKSIGSNDHSQTMTQECQQLVVQPSVPSRRSNRDKQPPIWLKDFTSLTQYHQDIVYPISNYLSYGKVSPKYQVNLSAFSTATEPTTYSEAVKHPKWVEAIKAEIYALQDNYTWDIVSIPEGKKPIGCKWVYKIKHKASSEIERFKAKLVAKGYSQQEGIEY